MDGGGAFMNNPRNSGYNGDMRHEVGIRDLRNALSRWIEKVKAGDEVVVTDHGKAVAMLTPAMSEAPARTVEEHLARLEARGQLIRGTGQAWRPRKPMHIPGIDIAGAIDEDREERS
jgi:prevent-host-death family protein